jgi:hypothetical protein
MDADLEHVLTQANAGRGPATSLSVNLQYHQLRATLLQVQATRELTELLKNRLHSIPFPRR